MFRVLHTLVLIALVATTGYEQIHFTATLDAAQAGTSSSSNGSGSFTLSDDFRELTYVIAYQGLSDPLSAGGHFCVGVRGLIGPVVHVITNSGEAIGKTFDEDWSSSDSLNPLTRALVDSLIAGRIYANFHTAANQAGEIRGQVDTKRMVLLKKYER